MDFEFLGLSDELLAAVRDAGYSEPTPIQRQAIPAVLQGRDVIGIAQTGTGKTAGFTLPMLDILAQGRAKARMPRSLILEPTRELAAQVAESFETYGKHHRLSMALLIGGVSFSDQETRLERGVDVLIATPGRLLDHFERGKLMLTGVQILVVDECDRMLDMGFIPDVERIVKLMPQGKQTLFFSATMPDEIKRLTDQFLRDPKVIQVAPPRSPAETVAQYMLQVSPRDKTKSLKRLLEREAVTNALVFCNRKIDVKAVASSLKRSGMPVDQLHGDMGQPERMAVLERFKSGELKLLVASDVAARGLDLPKVSHVVNYDVPQNAEDYIHRIGRTGRAGRKGVAVMLATPRQSDDVADIEKAIGRKIERTELEGLMAAPPDAEPAGQDTGEEAKTDNTDETTEAPPSRGGRKRGGRGRSKGAKPEPAGEQPAAESPPEEATAPEKASAERVGPAEDGGGDDAPPKPAKKRGRRGGRKRGGRKGKADGAPAKEASKSDVKDAPRDRDRGGRGRKDAKKGGGKGGEKSDGGKAPVGMGAHVPAFLKRPVPKRGRAGPGDIDEGADDGEE